jgi:hypothetical protein
MHPTATPRHLSLAYVEDAHNQGCLVRLLGERIVREAHFSPQIQHNGVVIRACHIVVVDVRHDPLDIVWRIGTRGAIEHINDEHVTVNLGYRRLTIPVRDARPDEERTQPLAVGEVVLLQGGSLEQATISDIVVEGELVHPERLQAHLDAVISRHDRLQQ